MPHRIIKELKNKYLYLSPFSRPVTTVNTKPINSDLDITVAYEIYRKYVNYREEFDDHIAKELESMIGKVSYLKYHESKRIYVDAEDSDDEKGVEICDFYYFVKNMDEKIDDDNFGFIEVTYFYPDKPDSKTHSKDHVSVGFGLKEAELAANSQNPEQEDNVHLSENFRRMTNKTAAHNVKSL